MIQIARFFRGQFFWALLIFTPLAILAGRGVFYSKLVKISDLNDYSIDEKRDIYSTFDAEKQNDKGLPIDPFDLMNRLKQAGAMSNATTPSDALDEALDAFDQSEYENVPIK